MSKTIGDIARELDIKPVVIINKLKELGIHGNTVNVPLTPDEISRLYAEMKITKGVKKVAQPKKSESETKQKIVIVKKPVKEEGGKLEEDSEENKRKQRVTVIRKIRTGTDTEVIIAKTFENRNLLEKSAGKTPVPVPEETKPEPEKAVEAPAAQKSIAPEIADVPQPFPRKPAVREETGPRAPQRQQFPDRGRIAPRPIPPRNDIPIPKPVIIESDKRDKIDQPWKAKKTSYRKDQEKIVKKEGRKEATKPVYDSAKNEKYETNKIINTGKVRLKEALSEEFILKEYYNDNELQRRRRRKKPPVKLLIEVLKHVALPERMVVKQLAEIIKKPISDVIAKLMSLDILVTINDEIDYDTAALIAGEYGITTEMQENITEEDILFHDEEDEDGLLVPRPPVVVVMGHVDHGKTSLLDTIKKTKVAASEAGSITQHIGACMVQVKNRSITFLDTPGHEAFTAMRRRGAQITDLALIVVAADDGVMPQTVEAINHAKVAGVSIIVVINKIDLPTANPDRILQDLAEHGLVPEEWGGDIVCVPVSAKTGKNIDHLLDMILLSADMLELKSNPNRQAKGTVVESRIDKAGVMATLLIQRGTLRVGEYVICGMATGRIKAMRNDLGRDIDQAGPSVPVEIMGLDVPPEAGELFYSVKMERTARSLADRRKHESKQDKTVRIPSNLDDLFTQIQEGKLKELNLIIKADVRGSVEALVDSLETISNEEVKVRVIHSAAGTISGSDVALAEVSNAIIIGFNVRPGNNVIDAAKLAGVDIRLYRVIYDAINDVKAAIQGMLSPKFAENITGHAEIRQIYRVSGVGTVAGCMVTNGKITRNSDVRLIRDGIIVYEGKLGSLKRFKDDVKEVLSGFECGLCIERFNDIKEGDVVEGYSIQEVAEKT